MFIEPTINVINYTIMPLSLQGNSCDDYELNKNKPKSCKAKKLIIPSKYEFDALFFYLNEMCIFIIKQRSKNKGIVPE